MKTTAGDRKRKSRFLINKIIGKYPPWRGYDATDLLNADNYLLFSLLMPGGIEISLEDLKMRGDLFAELGSCTLPVLAIEKNGKEIIFLLRKYSLTGLKDYLEIKENTELKGILRNITETVISGWEKGLYFDNITIESIAVIDGRPLILPTAYLIPGGALLEITDTAGKINGHCNRINRDLQGLGELFSLFQTFLTGKESEMCADITRRLTDKDCTGNLFETLDMIKEMLGLDSIPDSVATRERFLSIPPGPASDEIPDMLNKMENGGVLMITGKDGSGRSSLLRIIEGVILPKLGMEGKVLNQDQVFLIEQDQEVQEEDGAECILIDDHLQDPFLCCHISHTIFNHARKGRLVISIIGERAPDYFASPLIEDLNNYSIPVETIELPVPDKNSRMKLFERKARPGMAGDLQGITESTENLALINCWLNRALINRDQAELNADSETLLENLESMERSILTFMAVFKFQIPLNILRNVYSTSEARFFRALQNLINLGLVSEHTGESGLANGCLCQLFSISSGTLAETVRGSVPNERRKQLSSNIVFILDNIHGVPSCYKNYHLLHSGDRESAAASYYKNFRKFLGEGSSSSISCMFSSFSAAELYDHLPMEMFSKLLVEAGDHFSFTGQFDEARKYYRKCRKYITEHEQENKLRSLYVEAIRKECDILERRGNFKKAEKILNSTIEDYSEQCTLKELSKLHNDLAWVYYRLGQFDRSWQNCIKVQKLIDKKELYSELAQSYNLMGTINWNRSKYEEAIFCHSKCLNLREQSNDRAGIASSFNNLGLVYRSTGKVAEAIDCFSKSMKIKQKINNIPGLAAAYLNLSLVYMDREDYEMALENSRIACSYAEKTGSKELLSQAYGTIGEINYCMKEYDTANEFYRKALDLCRKTKSTREEAIVLRRMSQLNVCTGQDSVAENLLQQARKYNEKIGSHLETALLNEVEGELLIKSGDWDAGVSRMEKAALELSILGRKNRAAIINVRLGELYLEAGNEPFSREHLIRSISLAEDNNRVAGMIKELQGKLSSLSQSEGGTEKTDSEKYRTLCRTISLIRTISDPQKVYEKVIETALLHTGMERGLIAVRNSPQEYYTVLASSGEFSSGDKMSYDNDIVSIINIANQMGYPLDTSRISLPLDKVSDTFREKHNRILCLPLRLNRDMAGSLYLDSSFPESEDGGNSKELVLAIIQQLATSLERHLIETSKDSTATGTSPPSAGKPEGTRKFDQIVSESSAMSMVCELIDGVKEMDTTVILTGESGTGKDLTAKTIHFSSSRKDFKFQAINVSALPKDLLESELFGHEKGSFTGAYRQKKGHFETAGKGTIFLNEIGDLPLSLQPKLLQVLEERTFFRVGGTEEIRTEARIITATNKDLQKLVKQGDFREDLYYRINIFPINIPSLRERKEDIAPLCGHFLRMYCRLYNYPLKKISPESMIYLQKYNWPGNIRQLESVIIRLIIVSRDDVITAADLPEAIVRYSEEFRVEETSSFQETIENLLEKMDFSSSSPVLPKVERSVIRKVVDIVGDKTKAAAILGISKPTLYKRLKQDEE